MAKKGTALSRQPKAPDLMLIALVAQFLERNGFNSAHRIFNTERKKRPKKEGWQGTFARDYTARFPTLETIFQTWKDEISKEASDTSESETSDSEGEESAFEAADDSDLDDNGNTSGPVSKEKPGSTSASSSGEDTDEDEMDVVPEVPSAKSATTNLAKSLKRKASSSSDSTDSDDSSEGSSTSEDETDSGEKNRPVKKQKIETNSSTSESNSNAGSNSESDSDMDSDLDSNSSSSSEDSEKQSTRHLKIAMETKLPDSDESSSDESSGSDDSSSEDEASAQNTSSALDHAASDSSGTIVGDIIAAKHAPESSSKGDVIRVKELTVTKKKKHTGAQPTRLATLSANTDLNGFISNDYVSYDYADKAYRDLIVTRGKGFTKEKNKKKRGSYRGGTIDTAGGKAFKFDD